MFRSVCLGVETPAADCICSKRSESDHVTFDYEQTTRDAYDKRLQEASIE